LEQVRWRGPSLAVERRRLGDGCIIRYESEFEELALWIEERGIDEVMSASEEVDDRWIRERVRLLRTEFGEFMVKQQKVSLLKGGRLVREAKNGETLKKVGIDVLYPVVCVSDRRTMSDYGFLPFIRGGVSGLHLIKEGIWREVSDEVRRRLVEAVAEQVGRMHAAGFVHGDLNPSNILIEGLDDSPVPFLLDLGGVRRGGFRGRVKDLARLWRSAREVASRTDALRFLKRYNRHIDGDMRRLIDGIDRRLRKIEKG